MKHVIIDTNIILDIALKRDPFFDTSARIFYLMDQDMLYGYITASTITDIYYISRREKSNEIVKQFITGLMEIVEVIGVDKDIIYMALQSDMKDFEDAVQVSAAVSSDVKIIVTRNKSDFNNCGLEVYTPAELLEIM